MMWFESTTVFVVIRILNGFDNGNGSFFVRCISFETWKGTIYKTSIVSFFKIVFLEQVVNINAYKSYIIWYRQQSLSKLSKLSLRFLCFPIFSQKPFSGKLGKFYGNFRENWKIFSWNVRKITSSTTTIEIGTS